MICTRSKLSSLAAIAAVVLAVPAWATGVGTPATPAPSSIASNSSASAEAAARAWSNSAGGSATAGGGQATVSGGFNSSDSSNFYVLPAPVGGTPLPPGMCARSKSSSFAIGWNFFSIANADSHTDMECLELLGRLSALRTSAITTEPRLPALSATEKAEIQALDLRVWSLDKPKTAQACGKGQRRNSKGACYAVTPPCPDGQVRQCRAKTS